LSRAVRTQIFVLELVSKRERGKIRLWLCRWLAAGEVFAQNGGRG
jgi:hypothetical protein